MKTIITMATALIAVLTCAAAGLAITYGAPDGNRHPSVGALLAPTPYSDGTWATCTGTLIAPTVFLTAAHCDQGVARVAITFDSVYDSSTGTSTGVHGAPTRATARRKATPTTWRSSFSTRP